MRNVSINDRRPSSMSPLIKTELPGLHQPSEHLIQDQPLDFSTKVRVHSNGDTAADDPSIRKVSNDSAIDCSNDAAEEGRPTGSELLNTDQQQSFAGQSRLPPVSMPMPNISTFLPQPSASMPGMGMFYPTPPVFPNFLPPGFPPGPMWPNPMAAMFHQQQEAARKMISQAANGKQLPTNSVSSSSTPGMKPSYGNKQLFGKQDMALVGPGSRPYPGMPNFPNPSSNIPDPNILADALKSHEEMFTAYKQQVSLF